MMHDEKLVAAENTPPPDAGGWKQSIERGELDRYHIQDIVRAARKINVSGDRMVLIALMGHISDQMINVLRAYIGTNNPNEGEDIIHDVQSQMIRAVLDPNSKDGEALYKAFVPRMRFRALDALKKEKKQRGRYPTSDDIPDDAFKEKSHNPVDHNDEAIHVEQVLNLIPDPKKRLAFRLHTEGYPIESSKGIASISEAVGKSERTVRTWIKDTQALLKAKIGEGHD